MTSNLTVTAQYQKITTPTLTVNNVTVAVEEGMVEIPVTISNNPGTAFLNVKVQFDDSVLKLSSASAGDVLDGFSYTKPKTYKNGCNLVWYTDYVEEPVDGEAFTLRFLILDEEALGNHEITLTINEAYDNDYNDVPLKVVNGLLTLTN